MILNVHRAEHDLDQFHFPNQSNKEASEIHRRKPRVLKLLKLSVEIVLRKQDYVKYVNITSCFFFSFSKRG